MGSVKNWLMQMEDDAFILSREEFVKKHGERQAKSIFDKLQDPEFDLTDAQQAMAEVALDLEIAAEEGR
jgi:hypothetical protein